MPVFYLNIYLFLRQIQMIQSLMLVICPYINYNPPFNSHLFIFILTHSHSRHRPILTLTTIPFSLSQSSLSHLAATMQTFSMSFTLSLLIVFAVGILFFPSRDDVTVIDVYNYCLPIMPMISYHSIDLLHATCCI